MAIMTLLHGFPNSLRGWGQEILLGVNYQVVGIWGGVILVILTLFKTRNYSNGVPTHNHLVCKQTLKWLSCVVSTYLYGAFDYIVLSCHIHVSEQVCTLQLPECQGTPCSKQTQYLKLKWQQQDSNLEFTLKNLYDMIITHSQMHHTTAQSFDQFG